MSPIPQTEQGEEMGVDLKVSVRRRIHRLRKDLAVVTGKVASLRDEITRHELIYDMRDDKRRSSSRRASGILRLGDAHETIIAARYSVGSRVFLLSCSFGCYQSGRCDRIEGIECISNLIHFANSIER